MSDGPFFKLTLAPGDDPAASVMSYSTDRDSPADMLVIARELRALADTLERQYPVAYIWRDAWQPEDYEIAEYPTVLDEDPVVDLLALFREKHGL